MRALLVAFAVVAAFAAGAFTQVGAQQECITPTPDPPILPTVSMPTPTNLIPPIQPRPFQYLPII